MNMSSSGSDTECDDVIKKVGVWEKISYTWLIKDVESHFRSLNNKTESPKFYSEQRDYECKIKCGCLPKSVPEDEKHLCLYLYASKIPGNKEVETSFSLSVRNSGDRVIRILNVNHHSFEAEGGYGWPKFIQWSKLLSSIPDNVLKIHAEVFIKVHSFDMKYHVVNLDSDFPEARLQDSMDDLFESSNFTDVVFEVEEAKLKAHRCILSARSPVFAAMFTHESIEKHSGVVKIVDFDSDSFKLFLRFVYTGKVDISSVDTAADLFCAAEKYDFPDLKPLCMNFITDNLNSSTIGPILLLAETIVTKDLKKIAMDYILENLQFFKDVEMEVYKLLEEKNPKLLTELLTMVAEKLD